MHVSICKDILYAGTGHKLHARCGYITASKPYPHTCHTLTIHEYDIKLGKFRALTWRHIMGGIMPFILSALCAISANLDTLAVCAAFGMSNVKIRFPATIAISLISTFGTFISMQIGVFMVNQLNSAVLSWTGAIILMGMGVWFIITGIREVIGHGSTPAMLSHPETADSDHSGSIELKESVVLAFALTVNNLGVGAAAGVAGLSVGVTTVFTFLFTFLSMMLGSVFGRSFLAYWLGKYASLLSGCVIFLIGLASGLF